MKYGVFFLFLICLNPAYAIDSLKLQLRLEQLEGASDTQQVRLLDELSWMLRASDNAKANVFVEEGIALATELGDSISCHRLFTNYGVILALQDKLEESIQYLNQSVEFFQRTQNKKLEEKTLPILGAVLGHFGNYQKADSILLIANLICKKAKDDEECINILMSRGTNFYHWKKYEEAKAMYLECLELSRKVGDDLTVAKSLMSLGLIEADQNKNYVKALEYYLQALKNDYTNDFFKSKTLNNIGLVYYNLGEFDKALEYHQQSLTLKRKLGLQRFIANSLNNIGVVYKDKLDYGEALKYFKESLAIKTKIEGTNNELAETYSNIGDVVLELNKYEEAEAYYKKSLKLEEAAEDNIGICRALRNLAKTYRLLGKFQKAIKYGFQSMELTKNNHVPVSATLAETISKTYEALGNFKQALFYKNQYWEIRDSTSGSEVANKIAELEIKYETAKKENDLKLEKERVNNLEQKAKIDQLKIGLLVLGCSMLALIIGILIYFYRKSKRRLIQHKEQAELKVENIAQENILLEQKNSEQQIQLNDYLKQLLEKSEQLQSLKNTNSQISKEENLVDSNIHEFLNANLQSEEGLKQFKYYFTMVHKDFFKNLNIAYPKLTSNDLTLAALIKLNLNNKEVAQILNIIPQSVKTARQRLYQKMNLADNDALRNYIIQL